MNPETVYDFEWDALKAQSERPGADSNYLGAKSDPPRTKLLRESTRSSETMNASPTTPPDDDDMPAEIDFSEGMRGKFYRPNSKHNLPIYIWTQTFRTIWVGSPHERGCRSRM
jgi:hypothetical protein